MLAFAMPDSLTRAEVEAVAALAHLELDPSELDVFARQLGGILAYAGELRDVDTSGVPPTSYAAAARTADRPDDVVPSLDIAQAFGNAPESDSSSLPARGGAFFKVPRVIELREARDSSDTDAGRRGA